MSHLEYAIVEKLTSSNLVEEVNMRLKEKWELHGEMKIVTSRTNVGVESRHAHTFYQALVRSKSLAKTIPTLHSVVKGSLRER